MNALSAEHDAAVQMIDTSIVRAVEAYRDALKEWTRENAPYY